MKFKLILIILTLIISFFVYEIIIDKTQIKQAMVIRVIDGDTIELDTGEKIRLLGINTPEKGMKYHNESENYLKSRILNKSIKLEITSKDKYGRLLAYVFVKNDLINKELINLGLANLYYYDTDKYYNEFKQAEKSAMQKEVGIWKKSENYGCLELKELKYIEETRCNNQEKLVLQNQCNTNYVTIKDSANHIFHQNLRNSTFSMNFSCIFNDAGDSLFIWDEKGLLLYYEY